MAKRKLPIKINRNETKCMFFLHFYSCQVQQQQRLVNYVGADKNGMFAIE